MKKLLTLVLSCIVFVAPLMAEDVKIGVVNFKSCVEKSKLGKKEQANFDSLRKQMESVLEEKEKALNEIGNKFNDPDYLDSLSPEAEAELKHKLRTLNQELSQHQNQYYQALNQANFKIIQKMSESVAQASEKVAVKNGLDVVLNEEGSFFYNRALDISDDVVKVMDETFDQNQQSENTPNWKGRMDGRK